MGGPLESVIDSVSCNYEEAEKTFEKNFLLDSEHNQSFVNKQAPMTL